jgi:hypothetical protein
LRAAAKARDRPPQALEPKAKRERERERCISKLLVHLATALWRGARIPMTYVPLELTLKTAPS